MHSFMSKYRYRKVKKLMEDRVDRRTYLKGLEVDDFEVITWFSKGNDGGYSEKLMKGSQ